MANLSAFYETKLFFCSATQFEKSLTFEEWNNKPDDMKAALLYLQFYDSICQAWHKANPYDTVDGERGVEEMMRYLMKNAPIISADPKRYTPQYIYRIAFNCLDCVVYYHSKPAENEISANYDYEGEELNLFDTTVDIDSDLHSVYESQIFDAAFWEALEGDVEAEKVVRYLISGDPQDLKKLTKRNKRYDIDPLRDVAVSLDKVDEVIDRIRCKVSAIDGLKEHFMTVVAN